jgi:hypothetical protein
MIKHILLGFSIGLVLSCLWWFLGSYIQGTLVMDFLCFISTPIAVLISKISNEPLSQEMGIYIYCWSILITIPLVGSGLALLIYFFKKFNFRK